jgi:prepilin-type N-terminal cleavage/methylation domain-containing protein
MLRKLNTKHAGFTLVEIMIVVAIIALLAAIAVPNFLRSRKRSQATQILEDCRIIDAAVDQYAMDNNKVLGQSAYWDDLQKYIKKDSRLYSSGGRDVLGNPFAGWPLVPGSTWAVFGMNGPVNVVINPATYGALSDVAPSTFWSPYLDPRESY